MAVAAPERRRGAVPGRAQEGSRASAAAPPGLPASLPGPRGPSRGGGGLVVGVDEAGRGPWAGPVVAAAVAVGPGARRLRRGVTDSKQLGEWQREQASAVSRSSLHPQPPRRATSASTGPTSCAPPCRPWRARCAAWTAELPRC
mmetsp:Transcript_20934/g.57978  ORF Transcript_20934/g.57978 Transcript_20934/m.57978 type:complete len:144 (+) Transcript_20934:50-481(+)